MKITIDNIDERFLFRYDRFRKQYGKDDIAMYTYDRYESETHLIDKVKNLEKENSKLCRELRNCEYQLVVLSIEV